MRYIIELVLPCIIAGTIVGVITGILIVKWR